MADDRLSQELIKQGVEALQIIAYATTWGEVDGESIREIDVVAFTSASTVRGLYQSLATWQPIKGAVIACIGPTAAAECSQRGLKVDIVAKEHSIPGLIRAIVEYFKEVTNG